MAIEDAEHEESSPDAKTLLITHLSCSLVGERECIRIYPDSIAYQAYKKPEAMEDFYCNYGFNPAFREQIEDGRLKISGTDNHGAVRIIELPALRFFLATLFLPQTSSKPNKPHPLIMAYLKAASI